MTPNERDSLDGDDLPAHVTAPSAGPRRRPRMRVRTILFAAVAITLGIAIAFVLADWVVFWWDMRHPPRLGDAAARQGLRTPNIYEDAHGSYRVRRYLDEDIIDPISGKETHFRTNALGYRGGPVGPKAADEYRILVLGDSITLSAYTEEAETYPAILETTLATDGRNVRVLNAGVAGAALREELLILNETGLLTQPDMVVVGLFLNDATRSRMFLLPEGLYRYSALARRFAENRFVNEALEESEKEYERLSGKPYPQTSYPPDAWRTDRAAFEKKIAEAASDWGRAWFQWAWEEMRPDLEIMQGLSRQYGFRLVVVLFPATIQWEAEFLDDKPQQRCGALMSELKQPWLDLLPVMRKAYEKQPRSLSFDHAHLRPEGNAIAANAIADFVRPLMSAGESAGG